MSTTKCGEVPVHPGKVLEKRLLQLDRPTAEIARMLSLSRQTLYELFAANQSLTPSVALRVAKLTATSAEMWLDIQQAYDLAAARATDGEILQNVPVLEERW